MQLWFLYRTEYHVAIKNDIGNPDIDNPDNPDIKMLMLSCQNTKINYKTLLVFFQRLCSVAVTIKDYRVMLPGSATSGWLTLYTFLKQYTYLFHHLYNGFLLLELLEKWNQCTSRAQNSAWLIASTQEIFDPLKIKHVSANMNRKSSGRHQGANSGHSISPHPMIL